MSPHDLSSPTSPAMDPEEIRHRKMIKRSKVIEELVRTEADYQKDLELCISEVLLPLRAAQACSQLQIYSLKSVHENFVFTKHYIKCNLKHKSAGPLKTRYLLNAEVEHF